MDTRITATSLFFGAIGDLLNNFGALLRIGGPWFALYIALHILAGRVYAHWVLYDVNARSPVPSEWYVNLMFLVMLGTVAASWHRFVVLKEAPSFLPQMRLMIILKYMLAWVVIGIIIGLMLLFFFGLPALLLSALVDKALQDVVVMTLQDDIFDPTSLSAGLLALAVGFVFLIIFSSILLLFRMGIGLPSVAILDGQGIGMRASWRATRGVAGAVFGASLWATCASIILYAASFGVLVALDQDYSTGREVIMRVGFALVDIVTMLVGTAVLTRIYRAVPEESL